MGAPRGNDFLFAPLGAGSCRITSLKVLCSTVFDSAADALQHDYFDDIKDLEAAQIQLVAAPVLTVSRSRLSKAGLLCRDLLPLLPLGVRAAVSARTEILISRSRRMSQRRSCGT